MKNKKKLIFLLITILVCILPMELCPIWNGQIPDHRNQYELLAEAILNGHINIEYNDMDERLNDLKNPYDPQERIESGVSFHWDHAFYKGKYYVYFGVAPVLLTFIPYKFITGKSLNTYHATQLYSILFIVGLFLLLESITKFFFKGTKFKNCYLLSALSILSILPCVCRPALYCTAIVSGLCMAVWSLYFYFKAIYGTDNLNKTILYATIGATFGALIFACRPPIGLINFIAIPLLISFFKKYGIRKEVLLKLCIVLLPYLVIGISLMYYNYIRFDSVIEFGQSYQLTIEDQHKYSGLLSRLDIKKFCKYMLYNFIKIKKLNSVFPYFNYSSVFVNYPILLFPYVLIVDKKYRKNLKENKIMPIYLFLMVLPFFIAALDLLGSNYYIEERYRMDEYYIMAILTFIGINNYYSVYANNKNKKKINLFITIISLLTLFSCFMYFFIPYDSNITDYDQTINISINQIINIYLNIIKRIIKLFAM